MNVQEILQKHAAFLAGEDSGERANLSGAYLSRANISGANLSGADLPGANISGAYLSRANISGANLSGANLSGANISGANLSGAYLSRADLSGANLSGAYLSRADLSGANLSGANLSGANLSGAENVYQFGPMPTSGRICTAAWHESGWMVQAGCFWGTLDELEKAVIEKHNCPVYLANIALLRAWKPQ